MKRNRPDSPRYESLRESRRTLGRIAPWVRFGLMSVGVSMFLEQSRGLIDDTQFTWGERRILAIVGTSYLVGFGLAAWISGKLITTGAGLIDVFIDQAEASQKTADLIEQHAVPTLGRIAMALENLNPPTAPTPPTPPPDDAKARAQTVARRAMLDGRWPQAEKLVAAFVRDHPGSDAAMLISELDDTRRSAIDDLRTQLDDARASKDGQRAIELRDALTLHLRGADLSRLDDDLASWLVTLIRSRARTETIRPELANLAARVADTFADTPSGAGLKASVPNLRRSAGLCPRCGKTHRGEPETCPRCSTGRTGAGPASSPSFTRSTTQPEPLEGE